MPRIDKKCLSERDICTKFADDDLGELLFDPGTNPFDFWRGLSPLQVASVAARTDFAASSFMFGLMDNNADAGLIVRSDQQLSDEQQEQICATLRNRRCRRRAESFHVPLGSQRNHRPSIDR